jgi:MFS family permease
VIVAGCVTATTSPRLFFVTLHLQEVLGWSATAAGLGYLPVLGAIVVASVAGPALVGRFGTTAVMGGGLAAIALGSLVTTGITAGGGYAAFVLPGGVLAGLGLGAGSVASTTAGTAAVPDRLQGTAAAVLSMAAQLGTAFGLAVLVTVASARTHALAGGGEPEAALVDGFRWAFAAAAGLALAGFALFLAVRRVARRYASGSSEVAALS